MRLPGLKQIQNNMQEIIAQHIIIFRAIGICGGGILIGLTILYLTIKYADSTKDK